MGVGLSSLARVCLNSPHSLFVLFAFGLLLFGLDSISKVVCSPLVFGLLGQLQWVEFSYLALACSLVLLSFL